MKAVFLIRSLLLILLSHSLSYPAEIALEGSQDGEYEKGEYLVTHDIVIEKGRTMSFAPGSTIRLKPNAGIVVYGALVCKGSVTYPIVFTSYRDRPGNHEAEGPKSFDWTGITVKGPAGAIVLDFARIAYSSFGVMIDYKRDYLNIRNTIFSDNGDRSLSIEKKIIYIKENLAYTFDPADIATPERVTLLPSSEGRRGTTLFVRPLRAAGVIAAIAGTGVCIAGIAGSIDSGEKYEAADPNSAKKYYDRRAAYDAVSVTGGIVAGLGIVGFAVSYLF